MNFDNLLVKVNEDYPKIVDEKQDYATVSILKNLANGKLGEVASSMQYMFQSVVSENFNEDISKFFEEVAIVEMKHQELLMEAIIKFGGIPKYDDNMNNNFNTSSVNYSLKLNEMLDCDIKSENFAIEQYDLASSKVTNESLKNLLLRIKEDEILHLKGLVDIKNNVTFFSL